MPVLWKNTEARYGAVAKGFHWLVAVIVIGMLALGLYMTDLKPGPTMFKLYALHKSFGVLILLLIILRLFWRWINIKPAPLPHHKKWEKIMARTIHIFFYIALIGMPLSGWLMSSAKGFSVSFFGLFTLPDLIGENKNLGAFIREIHEVTAYTLIGALTLHIAGVLKHHIIDHDKTLRRMLPVFLLAFVVVISFPAHAKSPAWIIDPDQSSITFEATQMGASFTGEFSRFNGEIAFDPQDMTENKAVITIFTKDVKTGSADRDTYIVKKAWLNTESFPESKFETTKFEKTGENSYTATANLTIRGVTLPVSLSFTLIFSKDGNGNEDGTEMVRMEGRLPLLRLDYGVGQGEWKDTKAVGNDVTIRISLVATRACPE